MILIAPRLLSILCTKFWDTGELDPACVLEQIEVQIGKAKEEAYSRIEILDKVEKWFAAREEECWLEEYNMVGYFLFPFICYFFALQDLFAYSHLDVFLG